MSEVLYDHEMALDLDRALDKVLPYAPPERTALDIALIEEAEIVASARVKHLYEIFDQEDVTSSLARSLRADSFYHEEYPDVDWHQDTSLIGLSASRLNGPQLLFEYGSDAVRNDVAMKFANEYSYCATKAIQNCVHYGLTIHQAENYLAAVHRFTSELHTIGHIDVDDVMLKPFTELGVSLALLLLAEDKYSNFEEQWSEYLSKEVFNVEDLVGEDGRVGEDMTTSFFGWIEDRILEYPSLDGFRSVPERYKYGYEGDEDDLVEIDRFTPYGSDAPYFREIARRRIGLEKAKTGSIQ